MKDALQRDQFVKARQYQRLWVVRRKAPEKDANAAPPNCDLALEPLVEGLDRKRTVHLHSHRADGLLAAIRMSKEFDFELFFQHSTEGYRVADELMNYKIPVSLTMIDSPGGKPEVAARLEKNGAVQWIERAGAWDRQPRK